MFIPKPFSETDLARLDWLAARDAFGTLVSIVGGAPFATQLPVIYRRDGERVVLLGHWSRMNAQHKSIEGQRALFIFHGPHAYISPGWYVEPKKYVPTWDYATAHLYGQVSVFHEPERLEGIVSALTSVYEAGQKKPWTFESAAGAAARLNEIVGFELVVDEVQLKFKLNQNHSEGNVRGAIAALSSGPDADAQEIAQLMEQQLSLRKSP